MVDVMLPRGGNVMIQAEAYFDESMSDDGNILCVAGYVFEKRQAKKLARDWNLALKRYRLPYFRMSECAHGNKAFTHLSKRDRIAAETQMIGLIKSRAAIGVAATVNSNEYSELIPPTAWAGTPYSFLCHMVIAGVVPWIEWMDQRGERVDQMTYFFESGHPNRAESNFVMNDIFVDPGRRASYRYGGHSFVPKIGTPAVQAADLLAWQWYTDQRHIIEGRPRRADCASLLKLWHVTLHVGRDRILSMRQNLITAGTDPQNYQVLRRGHHSAEQSS